LRQTGSKKQKYQWGWEMGMGQFFIAVVMASGFAVTFGILLFDEWSAKRRADRGR
jgi:hypothetical protein